MDTPIIIALAALVISIICLTFVTINTKSKNNLYLLTEREKSLEELDAQGFVPQVTKQIVFNNKIERVVYFDYANKSFAVETIDYKNMTSHMDLKYPLNKISAVALICDNEIIHQDNVKPGISLDELYGLTGSLVKTRKDSVSSVIVKVIFEGQGGLSIDVLIHNIKYTDNNYDYLMQVAKELYDIFEIALLKNWMHKEKITTPEKPKVEKNYQDMLWDLKNYREEGIVSELMTYTKKLITEDK